MQQRANPTVPAYGQSGQSGLTGSGSITKIRRAVAAAVAGNVLEWFDFAVYAYLASYISKAMFPAHDDVVAMLGTFGAFGLGFVARPLGGILFGWLGDTRGRKWALSVVMPFMALATLVMGILPTYDSIGRWAPILLVLVRLLQGLSVGGEIGNSIAFLIEWSPEKKRGFYGSLQQCSTMGGFLLGSGAASLAATLLTGDQMASWGWRVPFIIGALVIGPLGWIIRRKSDETPSYVHKNDGATQAPTHSAPVLALQACGLVIVWTVSLYTLLSYLPSFTQKYAGVTPATSLWLNTAGLLLMTIAIPLWGALSDRVGRKPLYYIGSIAFLVLPYPMFHLMVTVKSPEMVAVIQLMAGVLIGIFGGVAPAILSELFPTRQRSLWMSIGYGVANAVFGGFAPMISLLLIQKTGSPISPSWFVMTAALITCLTLLTVRESAHKPLPR